MLGDSPENPKAIKIRHTMIRVSDLKKSVSFYTKMLGMKVMRSRESHERGEKVAYVGYGDEETHHALELVEMMDPPGEYFHGNTYGHVALLVTSVKKISEMLKEQGVEFSLDPHHVRPENPNMLAFIKDPDGYEIELTERR